MFIDKVIMNKSGSKGEASVYLADDDGNELVLNKFQINISNGANPVEVLRAEGTPIVSGSIIDMLKEDLLDMFMQLKKFNFGMFEFSEKGVAKIGE